MIQNLIKQAFLDGYAKGEKCDWIKPNDAKENMANGYAVKVVNKNDLLPDVSGSASERYRKALGYISEMTFEIEIGTEKGSDVLEKALRIASGYNVE